MKFALIYYEDAAESRRRNDEPEAYWAAWSGYIDAMGAAGIMAGGEVLQLPAFSTTLRGGGVQDGPYAETKDQLGGFVTIRVDSIDEAMAWAAKAPCVATGAVEIRPILEMAP